MAARKRVTRVADEPPEPVAIGEVIDDDADEVGAVPPPASDSDMVTVRLAKNRGLTYQRVDYGPNQLVTIPRALYKPGMGEIVG